MAPNNSSDGVSVLPAHSQPARIQQSSIRSFFQPRTQTQIPSSVQILATTVDNSNSAPPPTTQLSKQSSSPIPSRNVPRKNNTIPQQATITQIDPSHVQPLRRINSLLLPVNYPDSFYHQITDPASKPSFSRTILWQDSPSHPPKVIGGVVCRLDPSLAPDSTVAAPKYVEGVSDIYVQSLALLSPYRKYGLAAAALQSVIETATEQIRVRIAGLYAHVWTENTEALEWYAARGFQQDGPVIDGYYKRLNPGSAWILRRRLSVEDHLAPTIPTLSSTATTPPKSLPVQTRPGLSSTASFQDRRPDREWNDLPEDVIGSSLLKPPGGSVSKDGSVASSRNSSRSATKKKKERLYPAAAFGA